MFACQKRPERLATTSNDLGASLPNGFHPSFSTTPSRTTWADGHVPAPSARTHDTLTWLNAAAAAFGSSAVARLNRPNHPRNSRSAAIVEGPHHTRSGAWDVVRLRRSM